VSEWSDVSTRGN